MTHIRLVTCSSALALALSAAMVAHPAIAAERETAPSGDHDRDAAIIVTAVLPRAPGDVLSATTVLSGTTLDRQARGSIGETLARQPGISASSFGPTASRPILRGFQGERVRILADGIGSFDVSNTSADHAVEINPLTADRIEVLRGPAALLYGSSAIGGVVNVIDSRIPRHVPDRDISVDAIGTLGSAARERSASAKLDVALSPMIVAHVDGGIARTKDLRVGGALLSGPMRAQAITSGEADIASLATLDGRLFNSASRRNDVAGGLALINEGGNLGFSVAHSDSLYGVPVRYALVPGEEAEQVRLKMRQTRADMRAEITPDGGFLETIRLRAGAANYRHAEIDATGAVGTVFRARAMEGRLELVQARQGVWQGASGVQLMTRTLRITGDEKFLPASETGQIGAFTLQSLDFGATRLEAGARIEQTRQRAEEDAALRTPAVSRSFTALSLSVGASQQIASGWRLGINLSRSERAPAAEELFARGPHAGTQAFEIGNPGFKKERSTGVEGSLRGSGPGWSLTLSGFYSRFANYIFDAAANQAECEAEIGAPLDLPCYRYAQAPARYAGAEIEGRVDIARWNGMTLRADGFADIVRARIRGFGNAPRIPAARVAGGLELEGATVTTRIDAEHAFAQRRHSPLETDTSAYTLVNASISWQPLRQRPNLTLGLSANNLFDVTARRASSVLKDYAPLAGRDFRLTARVGF